MGATGKTLMPNDWVRLEHLINELYALVLNKDTSFVVLASDITVIKSDMLALGGTIEIVDSLPDPVVQHKVVLLTTDGELYLGKAL